MILWIGFSLLKVRFNGRHGLVNTLIEQGLHKQQYLIR